MQHINKCLMMECKKPNGSGNGQNLGEEMVTIIQVRMLCQGEM